jgi:hypothetical protein
MGAGNEIDRRGHRWKAVGFTTDEAAPCAWRKRMNVAIETDSVQMIRERVMQGAGCATSLGRR